MARSTILTTALIGILTASLAAQDAATQAARKQAGQRLHKALTKMAGLPSCAFSTELSWQQGEGNRNRAQVLLLGAGGRVLRPGTVDKVQGAWDRQILSARCNDRDELVLAGRRLIARQGKGEWKLRGGRLADGDKPPFLFDAELLFDQLRHLAPEVAHAEVGTWNDRPIEILTVTLTGDDAVELLWSGALPEQGGGLAGLMVMGGGGGAVPKPEAIIDLAFFVDPATQLVHELQIRTYSEPGGLAGRVVALGAGGVAVQQEEEEEEEPADSPLQYRDGLPVRKVKDRVLQKLDVTFSDHGKAELPELDEAARRLLGLK